MVEEDVTYMSDGNESKGVVSIFRLVLRRARGERSSTFVELFVQEVNI